MRSQTKRLPPVEFLRLILDYSPDTGLFVWKAREPESFPDTGRGRKWATNHWATVLAGKPAFTRRLNNCYASAINGKTYMAHRIAWAIYYGEDDPTRFIDHINGDSLDNRIVNLRLVTHTENMRNRSRNANHVSECAGVYQEKRTGKWYAFIGTGGSRSYLGSFQDKSDAISARLNAERLHGYHPNHGRPKPTSISDTATPASISA